MTKYLITKPDDVLKILVQFKKQTVWLENEDLIFGLTIELDGVRQKILKGLGKEVNWKKFFLRIGFLVYSILKDYGSFDEQIFTEFLMNKHKLYGAEPLLVWKQLGIVFRLDSKMARLKNIVDSSACGVIHLGDEAVEDTLKDILGYAVLGCLL